MPASGVGHRPIAFTFSSSDTVTTITVGYDFNGCSGSETFSNLRHVLQHDPSVSSHPSFNAGFGDPDSPDGPSTEIYAVFPSTARAQGRVDFHRYPGCESATDVYWTATKQ
jgi:hypothetical protein